MAFFKKKDIELAVDKNTHLLVLDQKWHELFKQNKSLKVQGIEKRLNNLLKEQGMLNTERKEYQKLKQKMMDEIVQGMGGLNDANDKKAYKAMGQNKKYIEQINTKLKHHEERLQELPQLIIDTNKELVNITMKTFYQTMIERRIKAEKLDVDVKRLREEIKEAVIQRDEAKEYHQQLYGYIHDVVGPEIIEQYDKYYVGDSND